MVSRWIYLACALPFLWSTAVFSLTGEEQAVSCVVSGYDISIVNTGETVLDEGTVVLWSVPFARAEGEYTLSGPLESGDSKFLAGVLGSSYLEPDTPCEVIHQ